MENGSSKVDKNNPFYFGNDASQPQPHVEENLASYHERLHEKATPFLQVLYKAVENDPSFTPGKNPSTEIKRCISKLDEINKTIKEKNLQSSQDPDLGIVRYIDLLGKWRPMLMVGVDEGTKKALQLPLLEYCRNMHYPATWANLAGDAAKANQEQGVPQEAIGGPSENNNSAQKQIEMNVTQHQPSNLIQQPSNGTNNHTATAAPAHQGTNPQHGFNMQGASVPQATLPPGGITLRSGVTLQGANGQRRVIAIKPRKTHRAVQPGFTSAGEKIIYIQHLGLSNANFVVTDAEGNIRLVSASSAGGQPALGGAKKAKVPSTLQDPTEIQNLRDLVRCGGEYGLEFVAIGEWDTSRKRLPFIVVLFYHQNENGRWEVALSRSSLAKILATREAENLIVESITGSTNLSLKEALMAQLSPGKQEFASHNANPPASLPSSEQNQQWWFQNPQHGPFPSFPAGPPLEQYLNQPQFAPQYMPQPVPQQYHQPFAHQFAPQYKQQPVTQQHYQQFAPQPQPGLFSMPPQPILDPAMMKHGANSPPASLMDEEL